MFITHRNIKRQSGVSVVTAIFLVVVLALMGVGMVSLLSTSQQSISQEITSAKALMAGHSCAQWGMYHAAYNATTGTFSNSLLNSQCTITLNTIINDGLTFFNLGVAASYGNVTDPEYSQRTLQLRFQP
jgi:MSHA biogenesis protein MshP